MMKFTSNLFSPLYNLKLDVKEKPRKYGAFSFSDNSITYFLSNRPFSLPSIDSMIFPRSSLL